jgi:hypothetical protein
LNLWAWVLLHPEAVVSAALAVLAVVGATIANARAKGAPASWLERFVDRIAVRTRANASNAGWSWPIVGRSIFEAAIDASAPRETQPPPPSEPGFVERSILLVVGGVAMLALGVMMLAGCSAGQTPVLSPISPRVIERAEYGTCAETGGKVEIPSAGQIALLTSVCWLRADSGAALDASPEPEPAVVADKSDAGAVVDAGAVE